MKNKQANRQIDSYVLVINRIIQGAEKILQDLVGRTEWFSISLKLFSYLEECTNACRKTNGSAHPQLLNQTNGLFDTFSNSNHLITSFLNVLIIDKAIPALETFKKSIRKAKQVFTNFGRQLENTINTYIDDAVSTKKHANSQEEISHGFGMHCTSLTYIRNLEANEIQIFESLDQFQKIVQHYINYMESTQRDIFTMFSTHYSFSIPQPKPMEPFDLESLYKEYRVALRGAIDEFKSPKITLPNEFNWAPTAQAKVIMRIKNKQEGLGILRLDVGDEVTVINAGYGVLWKVRNQNGLEGFVSSDALVPVEK